jgi:Protein of unknown function (DUF3466)
VRTTSVCAFLSLALCFTVATLDCGDATAFFPVSGGPVYLSSTDIDLVSQGHHIAPGNLVNNSGTAVGSGRKYRVGPDYGLRAVRLNGSGANAAELGNLGTSDTGYTDSIAYGVNDGGTAVGFVDDYDMGVNYGPRAVRWDNSGTNVTELGTLGTDSSGSTKSIAYAVNNNGTTVGFANKYIAGIDHGPRAVRWDGSSTNAIELGNLGTNQNGNTDCRAYAVNDSGTAVGWALKYESESAFSYRAVRWDGSGTIATELGHLGTDSSGFTLVRALAVNNSGTAVGSAIKYVSGSRYAERAVRWDGSGTAATELGLPASAFDNSTSRAFAVNNSGTAVGYALTGASGVYHGARAVRWDGSGTTATQLGDLGTDSIGYTETIAYEVNDSGIAVGSADRYVLGKFAGTRAVAWMSDGLAIDLNTLIDPASGWILKRAYSISDTGWVTGFGVYDPDGPSGIPSFGRLFVMQIPEPSALLLAGFAIWVVAPTRRRRG